MRTSGRQARTRTANANGRNGASQDGRREWTPEEITAGHARYDVLLKPEGRTPAEEQEFAHLLGTLPMYPMIPQEVREGLAIIAEARRVLDTWADCLRNPRREGTYQQAMQASEFFTKQAGELGIPY